MESDLFWKEKIESLKGIGDKTAALFHRLDIYTMKDLLYYLPREYEEYGTYAGKDQLREGDIVSVKVRIPYQNIQTRKAGRYALLQFFIMVEDVRIEITYYNMIFLKNLLTVNSIFVFRGKLTKKKGSYSMEQPKYYTVEEYEKLLHFANLFLK